MQQVCGSVGGKGGGSKTSAQCSGTNVDKLPEVVNMAKEFAKCKIDN